MCRNSCSCCFADSPPLHSPLFAPPCRKQAPASHKAERNKGGQQTPFLVCPRVRKAGSPAITIPTLQIHCLPPEIVFECKAGLEAPFAALIDIGAGVELEYVGLMEVHAHVCSIWHSLPENQANSSLSGPLLAVKPNMITHLRSSDATPQ